MPINGVVLGAAFVAGVQPTDPLGIAGWTALGAAWATWTLANVVPTAAGTTPLVATPALILGKGTLVCGPSPVLGALLAAAALTVDPVGLAKWLVVAAHYTSVLGSIGEIDPSLFVGYTGPSPPGPPIGPVTGTGGIAISGDFDFAGALAVTDAPGIAKWQAVGSALKTHLTSLGVVTPSALTNPFAGGPVLGTGTLT